MPAPVQKWRATAERALVSIVLVKIALIAGGTVLAGSILASVAGRGRGRPVADIALQLVGPD